MYEKNGIVTSPVVDANDVSIGTRKTLQCNRYQKENLCPIFLICSSGSIAPIFHGQKDYVLKFYYPFAELKIQSTAPERAVIKTSYKVIGRNDVTGPRDVKITHFPRSPWRCAVASADHESETRQSAACADRFRDPVSWHFRTVRRPFPVSLFLSFFLLRSRGFSFLFFCLTSLFVCARAWAFLFCSGWLLDFPAPFSLLSICHPLRKIHKHDEC